jgi:phenylacetate-CoA ligase
MHYLAHKALINAAVPTRLRLMRRIRRCEGWDEERIRSYQQTRLRELIRYCWEYIPFYRSRWRGHIDGPADIRTIEDLERLPILSKDELRDGLAGLITTAKWIRSEPARTGGSTGRPTLFRMTKYDQEAMWAQMYTGWQWAGYRVGDPFLAVGGESIGVGLGDRRGWRDRIMHRWSTSGSNLTLDRARTLVQSPHFQHIRLIYGYPNAIRELGELLDRLGARLPRLKGIVCTAEVMRPEVRERISETFGGVAVFDQYGLNDGGLLAVEGPEHDGLHLFFHRGILEILGDDNRQITGLKQPGRAVATCFTNLATPFVRYETGDQVHWHSREAAPSGIGWPRIGPVDGRTGDVIYLPAGRSIAMPGLTLVMRWMDGLRQYQFIQTGPSAVTARLDRDRDFRMSEDDARAFLRQRIADEIDWSIDWAPPELTRNGKLLLIRNDWLRRQGLTRPDAATRG